MAELEGYKKIGGMVEGLTDGRRAWKYSGRVEGIEEDHRDGELLEE